MIYLKQKWFGNTLFLSIFLMCSKRWYIEMESCTTNERVSIPRWKWTSVEHWALVCEILAPLWNTGRGWGHTSHTCTQTHIHSPPLEGHSDKLFPSCSAILFLLGSKHHSRTWAFQESHVNPNSVWALFLHPSCAVLHYNNNIHTAICVPNENSLWCI